MYHYERLIKLFLSRLFREQRPLCGITSAIHIRVLVIHIVATAGRCSSRLGSIDCYFVTTCFVLSML